VTVIVPVCAKALGAVPSRPVTTGRLRSRLARIAERRVMGSLL
jgi:hypothetical protein